MADLLVLSLDQKVPYQASKWLKVQVLLDPEELGHLFEEVPGLLYDMERRVKDPLLLYRPYIDTLKQGQTPAEAPFAWYWTKKEGALYLLETMQGRQVRVREPVVQISHHQMNYTPEDNTFRSNLFGPDTIFWGLQFAFPQLFQDPTTKEILKVQDPSRFPNLELFKGLQKWLRAYSLPTPFETVNAPQRIGKQALAWVANHPHLRKKGLNLKKMTKTSP